MRLDNITAVILAGGLAKRMGGQDKGLITLFGKPLYQHSIDKLKPQVGELVINANRHQAIYQQSGYPVISDTISGFAGPLAGMLAGLEYSHHQWVLFAPCDTPFIPDDLALQLWQNRADKLITYVNDGERDHPTLCLMNKALIPSLTQFLQQGDKKLMLFLQQQHAKPVIFNHMAEAFQNINTLDERDQLENRTVNHVK